MYLCSGRTTHSAPHYSAPLPYSVDVPHESGPEGQMDFCRKGRCNGRWKPPGTHHCSTCGTCRMGFDHHCPWVTVVLYMIDISLLMLGVAWELCLSLPHEGISSFTLFHRSNGATGHMAHMGESLATRLASSLHFARGSLGTTVLVGPVVLLDIHRRAARPLVRWSHTWVQSE